MDKKKLVQDFINSHTLCTLATVSEDNKPENAVIEYGNTSQLELIFDTFKHFRKYKNIKHNPHAAVVIGWDDITIQYEGLAIELDGNELEQYKKIYFKKLPKAEKWSREKGIVYFKIIPEWIRYSDLHTYPWKEFELSFSLQKN